MSEAKQFGNRDSAILLRWRVDYNVRRSQSVRHDDVAIPQDSWEEMERIFSTCFQAGEFAARLRKEPFRYSHVRVIYLVDPRRFLPV